MRQSDGSQLPFEYRSVNRVGGGLLADSEGYDEMDFEAWPAHHPDLTGEHGRVEVVAVGDVQSPNHWLANAGSAPEKAAERAGKGLMEPQPVAEPAAERHPLAQPFSPLG